MGLVGKLVHEDTSFLKEGEHSSASKRSKIAHQQTLDCYSRTVTVLILNCYSPTLLRFLTISIVIELHLKRDGSRWKASTRGYRFSEGRRSQFCLQGRQNCSSTNIGLLLLNCYCLFIELLLCDSPQIFNYI
jgi:hypothetical protein